MRFAGGTVVYFTLAANSFAVLPIELTNFAAIADGSEVALSWTAMGGTDEDQFQVERSGDGVNWQPIGIVEGKPVSGSSAGYKFIDSFPLSGANYYRIEGTGAFGGEVWSEVREVAFGAIGVVGIRVYPNPVTDAIHLQYPGQSLTAAGIRLITVTGQEVAVPVQGGVGEATVGVGGLAPGVYFLQVKTTAGWKAVRLLKQ